MHFGAEIAQPIAAVARRALGTNSGMTSSSSALSSCWRLNAASEETSVPALLDSTPGVSRNSSELKSFFSGTTRFSRRYCATTGAGMPCAA